MADEWQVDSTPSAQVVDDDEAPEDWEAALEEKVCSFNLYNLHRLY